MKVLVIGSGGREHAICKKLAESKLVKELYCAPGNAGIKECAILVPIGVMEFEKIASFSKDNDINLVFVAPDNPLADGLVNFLEEKGINAFGPRKEAAIIDPQKIEDFSAFQNFANASSCLWLFHGGDYDISMLAKDLGI